MRIAVVGGGSSGLVAAIVAARKGCHVTILERSQSCGRKLLMTGNGRCNYWNEDQNLDHYHSKDWERLSEMITEEHQNEVLSFFSSIGILPRIKNGYYYPYSNQATSIKNALLREIERLNIEIKNQCFIEKIEKKNHQWIINKEKENLKFDRVILATGSKAYPKTGSDGNGYLLAKSFGHSLVSILPSLVQLRTKGNFLKEWNGVRTDTTMTLWINGKKERQEKGEVQLTDYGISGICTFNLSGLVAKALESRQKVVITINFCPFVSTEEEFLDWFSKRNKQLNLEKIEDLLEGFLNYKLIPILLKNSNILKNKKWIECTKEEKQRLAQKIVTFPLEVIGTNSFDKAQVCSGGVPLHEINLNTMESLKEKGIYFCGEILDVDGDCGGYNLGFAWISAIIAGKGVSKHD